MSLKEIEDGEDNQMVCQTHHKGTVGSYRMPKTEGLRKTLEVITDPLDQKNHTVPGEIVNIVNIIIGRLGTSAVNVSDAVAIRETMWNNFKKSWPDGFYETITKKVTTMAVTKKSVPVGECNLLICHRTPS